MTKCISPAVLHASSLPGATFRMSTDTISQMCSVLARTHPHPSISVWPITKPRPPPELRVFGRGVKIGQGLNYNTAVDLASKVTLCYGVYILVH